MHHILKTGFSSKLDVTISFVLFLFCDYNIYTQTFRHTDLQIDKMWQQNTKYFYYLAMKNVNLNFVLCSLNKPGLI